MEPLPYKEPHRPPALSYESPLQYAAIADRQRAWAEQTRRITSKFRTFVLIAFAVLWSITATLFELQIAHGRSPKGGLLIGILLCLAMLYVILVAVGTAHRPSAILPRLFVFAVIAVGWSYTVTYAVDTLDSAYKIYYAYGLRGLSPSHQPSNLYLGRFTAFLFAAALTAAGIVCYVLLQVFVHNRTYRPKTDTN